MSASRRPAVLLLALLVPTLADAEPRRAAAGDPLPDGAIARFGSARLRHGGPVYAVAFSPDGKSLAAGSIDGGLSLWDASDGRELVRFTGAGGGVRALAFTADGRLAAAGGDGVVRLWDAKRPAGNATETRGPSYAYPKAGGGIDGLAASPAGLLAVAADDGTVNLYEAATGKERHRLPTAGLAARGVAFSPDGKSVAAVLSRDAVHVWDAESGNLLRSFKAEGAACLAFRPDGGRLAVGTFDNRVLLVEGGEVKERLDGPKEAGESRWNGVHGVAFSADGSLLAAAGGDGTVCVWETKTGKLARLEGHRERVTAVAFAPKGNLLASGGGDNLVRLWDAAGGKEVRPGGEGGAVVRLAAAPDGKGLALLRSTGTLTLGDPTTGAEKVVTLEGAPAVRVAGYSPDGATLAAAASDGTVRFLDPATGRERRRADGPERPLALTWSGDGGALLAAVGSDRRLSLWDPATGKPQRQVSLAGDPVRYLALAPHGRLLAGGGTAASLWLWDTDAEHPPREMEGHPGGALAVAFGPDGRVLASGGKDRLVRLWESATARQQRVLGGHAGWVRALAFSPDGRALASGGDDGVVRLWDVAAGRLLQELHGHRGGVTAVAFLTDGRVVSGGQDGTAVVWDVAEVLRSGRPTPLRLTAAEVEQLWTRLGDPDPASGSVVVQNLSRAPDRATPLLKERLKPVNAAVIARALRDLDSEDFATREKAMRDLAALGQFAETSLREALKKDPPLEVRNRLVELLRMSVEGGPAPEYLQALRGVQVLELIGTPEAREVLRTVAGGAPESELTLQAKAALQRLEKMR
jgi:WD40 repeat protein